MSSSKDNEEDKRSKKDRPGSSGVLKEKDSSSKYVIGQVLEVVETPLAADGGVRKEHQKEHPRVLEPQPASTSRDDDLVAAVRKRDLERVRALLRKPRSAAEGYGFDYRGALQAAARLGDEQMVALLLRRGVHPSWNFQGALQVAVKHGHAQVAALLCETGKDVTDEFYAVMGSMLQLTTSPDVVLVLVREGADVNWNYSNDKQTALHGAISSERLPLDHGGSAWEELITTLLSCGADTNARDAKGKMPLHLAVETEEPDIVTLLVRHSDNVNAATYASQGGHTALHLACSPFYAQRPGPGERRLLTTYNCARILTTLLEAGADVNARDALQRTPLHYAAASDSPCLVAQLLEAGSDRTARDAEGRTFEDCAKGADVRLLLGLAPRAPPPSRAEALLRAARRGQTEELQWLLQGGKFGPSALDVALEEAAGAAALGAVRLLVESGADVNTTMCGTSPLHCAALAPGHAPARARAPAGAASDSPAPDTPAPAADVVRYLVSKGAHLTAKDARWRTALHASASAGAAAVAAALLGAGADARAVDSAGWTPLHCAARAGNAACVALLGPPAGDVAATASGGWTALHCAADADAHDVATLLLREGADVSARARRGWTALHCAAWARADATAAVLLDAGARASDAEAAAQSPARLTPLHLAALSASLPVATRLLAAGADVNACDRLGRTPLHCAAVGGNGKMVSLLVKSGADVQAKCVNEKTPLLWAAGNASIDAIFALLQNGADLDASGYDGSTLLHWAARRGDHVMLGFLLDYGADPNARTLDGRTPLHCALEGSNYSDHILALFEGNADVSSVDTKNLPSPFDVDDDYRLVIAILLKRGADQNAKDKNGISPLSMVQCYEKVTENVDYPPAAIGTTV